MYNDVIRIRGGQIPKGSVTVSGAKNSATRLLAAASICDEPVTLTSYPTNLVDSKHKERFLNQNNVRTRAEGEALVVDPSDYRPRELDDYYFPIRTTYLLVAGQLKRSEKAFIPYPGGCNIGDRKYDLHIMVWEAFGCDVRCEEHCIVVTRPSKLKATRIEFPISTVGGTENALLCAAVAEGTTEIYNAYITPEIEDLIAFLRIAGVDIQMVGKSYVRVTGAQFLRGQTYAVMPDRIEALTWIVYGILSGGEILVQNVPFQAMEIPLMHLQDAGIDYYANSRNIFVSQSCLTDGHVHSFEISCGTHPGIISDMQPFYVMLGLLSVGTSRIHDYRYPARIGYIEELQKFVDRKIGAQPGVITTCGPVRFSAANAKATDLRGTMAAVMAALCAPSGVSTISGVSMALRGYNNLVEKLATLGVQVEYHERPESVSLDLEVVEASSL